MHHSSSIFILCQGIDDVTGERLVRREDDESETIRKRWEGYAKTEALVCKHYRCALHAAARSQRIKCKT